MNNTDKVYLIKWIGPFSKDELRKWEDSRKEIDEDHFHLYLLQGKEKRARHYSYYCGQTKRHIYERLSDKDHPSQNLAHGDYSIWIGKFANIVPDNIDINAAEKIITCELAELELGLDNMLNRTNHRPPKFDVYLINQWYHSSKNKEWKRIKRNSPANFIPDLMIYNADSKEFRGTRKIRSLGICE